MPRHVSDWRGLILTTMMTPPCAVKLAASWRARALSRGWGYETGRRYFQAGFPVEVETTWPGS